MTTTTGFSTGLLDFKPSASFVIGCAISALWGVMVGITIATVLWFRYYLADGMSAIETYAGKEWGEK